jgi:hypothetical protein
MTYEQQSSESFGWLVTSAYESNNFANDAWRFGGEVGWNQMFFLRAGYAFVSQARDDKAENIFGPTFGAGINLNAGSLELVFDYAYRLTEYFDDSQVFALRLFF